ILTVTDINDNATQDTVYITLVDVTPPFLFDPPDTTVIISGLQTAADIILTPPVPDDNCTTPVIIPSREDGEDIDAPYPSGATTVWWKACDAAGNCDSVAQQVNVTLNGIPTITAAGDTTIDEGETLRFTVTASDPEGTIPRLSASSLPAGTHFIDNGDGTGEFSWDIGCDDHGVYTVAFQASDDIDSSTDQTTITVRNLNFTPEFNLAKDTTAPENQLFTMLLHAEDCDNDDLQFRAIAIPPGSGFEDNGNGTATFSWEPDCNDNGFYVFIFEVSDGTVTVRDTILVQILDVNCFNPEITLSEGDFTTGINLPVSIAIHAEDRDGTIPELESGPLPAGADFTVDSEGNAIFTWTPEELGSFDITFHAVDEVDDDVRIDTTITITVVDENFSGPLFLPVNDTIIDENQELTLSFTAEDQDGTIPTLGAVELPSAADFTDNGDGSGTVVWLPGCNVNGNHTISVYATDGKFRDTAEVLVTVRDRNCPPVLMPISDKNVALNSTVRFSVTATDPDEDGTVPELSVACNLPGYTFSLPGDGTGTFEWKAVLESGSYPVTFYANDGFLIDSQTVTIAVDQTGSAQITTTVSGAKIYALPTAASPGTLLGTGEASFTAAPGVCWFRAEAPGYRPATFTVPVFADSTVEADISLKPSIPLMLSAPESLQVGTGTDISGSITFIDFDGDGIQDLSVANDNAISVYLGSDDENGRTYSGSAITLTLPSECGEAVAHTYVDWDNSGDYECLVSFSNGDIRIGQIENEDLLFGSAVISRDDETLFPAVIDINKDNRKDLLVTAAGEGVYLYINGGTDNSPIFNNGDMVEALNSAGNSITNFGSTPILWDMDSDGWGDLIGADGESFRLYSSRQDSSLKELPSGEDLNAGGRRIASAASAAVL
ncbi:MAG: Ig-like domain-containing protein, partial [Candidatus Pacearchaeota archaeon]|nr:Ig-like domain-containing protein [Candidatus Pacearchaeota archaeon]